jgi:hypothetical protein
MGGRGLSMSNNNKNSLNDKLVIEEFRQRYEQYRMHNENRNKYIHFYFIFYFAFWGLVGFLFNSGVKCFLAKYCISVETFLAFAFMMHAIFGSIFFLSIISFRQIQSCEAKTLNMLRKLSNTLQCEDQVKYPWDREIPWNCKGITVTSQTPLVILIFLLNILSFFLSCFFLLKISIYFGTQARLYALFILLFVIFLPFIISNCWKPRMVCLQQIDELLKRDNQDC